MCSEIIMCPSHAPVGLTTTELTSERIAVFYTTLRSLVITVFAEDSVMIELHRKLYLDCERKNYHNV